MEILLLSHHGIASGMKRAANMIVGESANDIATIELTAEDGVEVFTKQVEDYITQWLVNGKIGVIFSDIKGGTPFNKAEMLLSKHGLNAQAKVICGMNLAMIVDCLFKEIPEWNMKEVEDILTTGKDSISCMDLVAHTDNESEDE